MLALAMDSCLIPLELLACESLWPSLASLYGISEMSLLRQIDACASL